MSVNLTTPPIVVGEDQTIQLQIAITVIRPSEASRDLESGLHDADSPSNILQPDECLNVTPAKLKKVKFGSIRGQPLAGVSNGIKYRTLPTRRPARLRFRQPCTMAVSSASTQPDIPVSLKSATRLHEDVAEHHDFQTEKMVFNNAFASLAKRTDMDTLSELDTTDISSVEEPRTDNQAMFDTVRQGFRSEYKHRNETSLRRSMVFSSSSQHTWSNGESDHESVGQTSEISDKAGELLA